MLEGPGLYPILEQLHLYQCEFQYQCQHLINILVVNRDVVRLLGACVLRRHQHIEEDVDFIRLLPLAEHEPDSHHAHIL